jgi:molecular chaperone IbpA
MGRRTVSLKEDMDMRHQDLSPLLRSTVGFDRMASLLDSFARNEDPGSGYPPYNIEKLGENSYRITMAVAGFTEDDLSITTQGTTLVIAGDAHRNDEGVEYLHRGIARRGFQRRFELAEHIEVEGARMENGLLHVNLRRYVPETLKPRSIPIKRLDQMAAKVENNASSQPESPEQDQAA